MPMMGALVVMGLAGLWASLLDPPAEYAAFPRTVGKTAEYEGRDFTVEVYRQANGPDSYQRVMMAVPKGLKGRAPCVIAPYYFPEAMLGFDPAGGTNLTDYAGIAYMADLARRGYVTVSAEAYHLTYRNDDVTARARITDGKGFIWRSVGEAFNRDWPNWSGVGKLVFDTRLVVDLVAADPRVDPARIGMIGHSLGGKMAFCAGLTDPRVKVVVASDFGLGWTQTNWEDVWYWGGRLPAMRAKGLSNVDLLSHAGGKPFCLIAGKYDDADSGRLMRSAEGYEGRTDRLLFIHHAQGHRPPRPATEEGYAFLDRFLMGGASPAGTGVTAELTPSEPRAIRYAHDGMPPVRTVPHQLDALVKGGHVQGLCCSEEGVYLSHSMGIEMIGWDGRFIRRVDAPVHLGDTAHADGKVYGAFGFWHTRPDGSRGAVRVWDSRLNQIAEKSFTEQLDGITVLNGRIYVGVGGPKDLHRGCRVKVLDMNLEELEDVEIDFGYDIAYGVQTMSTLGNELVFGNYGGTSIVSADLKTSRRVRLDAGEGVDRVPPSVVKSDAPLYIVERAENGGMRKWKEDPVGNPPVVRLDFCVYTNGGFKCLSGKGERRK